MSRCFSRLESFITAGRVPKSQYLIFILLSFTFAISLAMSLFLSSSPPPPPILVVLRPSADFGGGASRVVVSGGAGGGHPDWPTWSYPKANTQHIISISGDLTWPPGETESDRARSAEFLRNSARPNEIWRDVVHKTDPLKLPQWPRLTLKRGVGDRKGGAGKISWACWRKERRKHVISSHKIRPSHGKRPCSLEKKEKKKKNLVFWATWKVEVSEWKGLDRMWERKKKRKQKRNSCVVSTGLFRSKAGKDIEKKVRIGLRKVWKDS